MSKLKEERLRSIYKVFEELKVFTLGKLVSALSCSIPNARLKLKQWEAHTSYNQNGRCYALPTVPCFDKNGLWYYEDVFFSQYGNLKQTVINLIESSLLGLTGKEIGALVRLDPRSFLHHFRNTHGIQREKAGGVYVYFSNNPDTCKQQHRLRTTQPAGEFLSEADAVVILCVLVKHHGICFEDIMKLPEIRKCKFSPVVIHDFLDHHGLFKKKAHFKALKLLKDNVDKLVSGVSAGSLFPKKPTIHFYPETEICPECGSRLNVRKSREKKIVTMDIGAFVAKEIIFQCPCDHAIFTSSQMRSLAPYMCTYGFDVIEYVGVELFVHSRNEREIMKSLCSRNVFISERGIGYLGKKFIVYLALAHRQSREKLVHSMKKRGGYILHVDGTCDGNSPHLFCGMDGITELILDNIKIPSEKKALLIPFFQRIKEQYGDPISLVHDMGIGILMAIEEIFPGVPDFICHFHFLRDIGKDLLLEHYQTIIKRLRVHKVKALLRQKVRYLENRIEQLPVAITDLANILKNTQVQGYSLDSIPAITAYTLIYWILESPSQSRGYGFPFDRPHLEFYRRLETVYNLLSRITDIDMYAKAKDNKALIQLKQLIKETIVDTELKNAVDSITEKSHVFDRLRDALRIAMPEGKKGLNDDGDESNIKTIEEKVSGFKDWLISEDSRKSTYLKMIQQLDKYWVKLFADPLIVNTPEGPFTIAPQRTNNILERFFRSEKRQNRKKSGTSSLNRTLKTILADTPLVRNLANEEYHNIILGDCSSLAERFSQIDRKMVSEQLKQADENCDKIPPKVKMMIKLPNLPEKISALFLSNSKFNANRHLRS